MANKFQYKKEPELTPREQSMIRDANQNLLDAYINQKKLFERLTTDSGYRCVVLQMGENPENPLGLQSECDSLEESLINSPCPENGGRSHSWLPNKNDSGRHVVGEHCSKCKLVYGF